MKDFGTRSLRMHGSAGLSFLLFIVINGVFIFKYGCRYLPIGYVIVILALYVVGIAGLVKLSNVKMIERFLAKKYLFYSISFLFFIGTILLNNAVDETMLNVDRWSAMHVGIKALLHGEYPYTAIDHLGGRTSNLPTLFLIGIPFYLLGDVGYLQCFSFMILAVLLHQNIKRSSVKCTVLLLIVTSPCYLYEIYVKSDMITNFIIILFYTIYSYKTTRRRFNRKPVLLGIVSSALVYTRLTAIIPMSLSLFHPFTKHSGRLKLIFVSSAVATILVLSLAVFYSAPSTAVLLEKNPFVLQNKQLPFILSLTFIIIPLCFSARIKNLKSLLKYCTIFLALPIFCSLFLYVVRFGMVETLTKSIFDLSYLNIITPFLFIYIGLLLDTDDLKASI